MKLLTINTHAWLEENQDEKMEILAKTIAEKQYDVIAMQEVNQLMNSPVIYDGIRNDNYGWKLLEKLEKYTDTDYYYHWSNSHIGFGKYDEGVAIITKHPIKDEDEFYCTFSQSVRVINARRIVKRTKNDNLKFLMGDFNTDAIHNQEAYQNIINQGLFDTYELAEKKDSGITVNKKIDGWATSGSEKRLDYIFSNKKVKVLESKVIFNGENKGVVSDHFGLEVKIEL